MDQRIDFLTKLKDTLPRPHHQTAHFPCEDSPQGTNNEEYLRLRDQVCNSAFFRQSNKHIRIRLSNWIRLFDGIKANRVWEMNRDNYMKLLSLMCYCGFLIRPFHQLPPSEDLHNLRKHEINEILNSVERELKNSSTTSRRSSRSFLPSHRKLKTQSLVYQENSTLPLLLRQTPLATEQSQIPANNPNEDEGNSFDLSESQLEGTEEEQLSRVSSLKGTQHCRKTMPNPLEDKSLNIIVPSNSFPTSGVLSKRPPLYPSGCREGHSSNSSKIKQTLSHWTNNDSQIAPVLVPNCEQRREVELVSYRQASSGCDCSGGALKDEWLGAFLRQILPLQ